MFQVPFSKKMRFFFRKKFEILGLGRVGTDWKRIKVKNQGRGD